MAEKQLILIIKLLNIKEKKMKCRMIYLIIMIPGEFRRVFIKTDQEGNIIGKDVRLNIIPEF
jgi:hypothetical protein